ncbi:hypothetical protein RUND412_007415 [Rhizina undulata]
MSSPIETYTSASTQARIPPKPHEEGFEVAPPPSPPPPEPSNPAAPSATVTAANNTSEAAPEPTPTNPPQSSMAPSQTGENGFSTGILPPHQDSTTAYPVSVPTAAPAAPYYQAGAAPEVHPSGYQQDVTAAVERTHYYPRNGNFKARDEEEEGFLTKFAKWVDSLNNKLVELMGDGGPGRRAS